MVYFFGDQKNIFKEKSEALLLNILPKEIVKILKFEHRTVADDYDTVGSTPLFADMKPVEVVDWSNRLKPPS